MKRRISVLLALLLTISALFSFGACTKTKTSSEQFQDAVVSLEKYFSEYLKAGSAWPDYSSAKGTEENLSMQISKLESGGQNLLSGDIAIQLHQVTDRATGTAACDGSLTMAEEKVPFVAYMKSASEVLFGFPEASEKYLSLMKQSETTETTGADLLQKLMDAVKTQLNETSIKSESVEYSINGTTQKGVTKLTFAPDEAQRKAIYDAINAALKESGADVSDADESGLNELSVTFYIYRGVTAATEFVLASDGKDPGKLSGNLTLDNQDNKKFDVNGKLSFTFEDTNAEIALNATQTVTDSGRSGNVTLGLNTGASNPEVTIKLDYQEAKEREAIVNTTTLTVSGKTGGATVSVEIPIQITYTMDGDKVNGTLNSSLETDTLKLEIMGKFDAAPTDSGNVKIPEILADQEIPMSDAASGSEAYVNWISELQAKYFDTFSSIFNSAQPNDPDAKYPVFYLSNEDTGEELEFYDNNTGKLTSYVLFEQKDGNAVITLDNNGSHVDFAYKPFGSEGYALNQQVQMENITLDAVVTEDEITLTSDTLGWEFWLMPEQEYGVFSRQFNYQKTDSSIKLQVFSEATSQELVKSGDQYLLGDIAYEYTDASDFAD